MDEKYIAQAEQFTGLRYIPKVQWNQNDHKRVERRATELRYADYVSACEEENLEAHSLHMWEVHGRPSGPLG